MAYDSYQQDGDFVENSGNRVVLFNDLYALKWSQGFWDDSLVATAGLRFAQGGPQGAEYLRETLGEVERQRSGFEGTDAFVELFAVPLQDVGQVSWLSDGALLDSWTLMVSADLSQDYIDLVDDAGGDGTYRRVRPTTQGILGQTTLSLLDKRVNLVAGLRYDDYKGLILVIQQLPEWMMRTQLDYVIAIRVNAFAIVKPARVTANNGPCEESLRFW